MSKQSNQKYRKQLEKKVLSKAETSSSNCSNSTKDQPNKFDYGDGDFDAPSNCPK